MVSREATLEVRVDAVGGDAESIAELTAKLRRELLQLDVNAVDQAAAGEAPPGAKGLEILMLGTLLVKLARDVGTLASVVHTVQGWLGSGPDRTVKLELDGDTIEISAASSSERQRLLDLWIERHAVTP
jgi:hypothetical protein